MLQIYFRFRRHSGHCRFLEAEGLQARSVADENGKPPLAECCRPAAADMPYSLIDTDQSVL